MRFMLLGKRVLLVIILTLLGLGNSKVLAKEENHLISKTDSNLYEQINNLKDDELIDVYLWKQSIEEEDYKTKILSQGFDETIYGDEEVFQKNIISKLPIFGKEDMTIAIRKAYRSARLKAIKSVTIEANQKFLIDNALGKNDIIYLGSYTSTIIVSLSKEDILRVVKDDRILGISLYKHEIIKDATNISVDQINAGDSDNGLRHISNGGFDGSGVKIGIIETGRFDPDSTMLSSLVTSGQLEFIEIDGVSEQVNPHATHVTSILVGESKPFINMTFEGVAIGSKVFQSAVTTVSDVYTAFNQFLDDEIVGDSNEVDIINFSGGIDSSSYTAFDQEIDNLIYTTKVLFVVAAGNNGGDASEKSDGSSRITSPARAYNAITVGNAETKSALNVELDDFGVFVTSSYLVNSYLSNKPEIVAPGVEIGVIMKYLGDDVPIPGTGTSASAPHVAGVLAQLMEKYGSTINNNNYVTYFKARLMIGANSIIINDASHRTGDSSIFYDKKGAGLVDATNSAQTIYGWNKRVKVALLSSNYYVNFTFPPAGDFPVRAVLIFEKPENAGITSDYGNNFDLYLEDANNQTIVSSTSTTNIFEILEGTIPANEVARLRIHRASYMVSGSYMSFSCFWMGV